MPGGSAGIRLAAAGAMILLASAGICASPSWSELSRRSDDWYRSTEGQRLTDHVLEWQTTGGSWPKGVDTTGPFRERPEPYRGTFDNGATTSELRFLARARAATGDDRVRTSLLRGLEHVLSAQYPNGGWPQFHPPGNGYARHITFNDDTMVRLLELVRDVGTKEEWAWVGEDYRQRATAAFTKGIECILKCQVRSEGRLTVWCAQHDEVDFQPRPARSYELISLSGAESARILRLLMSLKNPSREVIESIEAGVAWFESVKLTGIRVERIEGDRVVREDPDASPLWARFYEIGTDRPIFSGRDGVRKYELAEIEAERRSGYAWYGTWGEAVALEYRKWQTRSSASLPH
jgi:PelA/Pel-15E family pectate lyase